MDPPAADHQPAAPGAAKAVFAPKAAAAGRRRIVKDEPEGDDAMMEADARMRPGKRDRAKDKQPDKASKYKEQKGIFDQYLPLAEKKPQAAVARAANGERGDAGADMTNARPARGEAPEDEDIKPAVSFHKALVDDDSALSASSDEDPDLAISARGNVAADWFPESAAADRPVSLPLAGGAATSAPESLFLGTRDPERVPVLVFLQLPDVLPSVMAMASARAAKVAAEAMMAPVGGDGGSCLVVICPQRLTTEWQGGGEPAAANDEGGMQVLEPLAFNQLKCMPDGYLGRLVVRKSGKIQLLLGNDAQPHVFDMIPGTKASFAQELVVVNTTDDAPFVSKLGDIQGRFIAAPNMGELLARIGPPSSALTAAS